MSLGTMEQRTEGMKKQAQELIEQAYHKGFKAGREDRQDWEKDQADRLIEQGRNEAWEAARKIFNEFDVYGFREVFGKATTLLNVTDRFTASEAIDKIKAYEERKKQKQDNEIHVGDEVMYHEDKGIVVCEVNTNICTIMGHDGSYMIRAYKHELVKTGKHYLEIVEVLKKMQEDN